MKIKVLIIAALLLAGCSAEQEPVDLTVATDTVVLQPGESYIWPDGIVTTLGQPGIQKCEGKNYMVYDIVAENKSAVVWEPDIKQSTFAGDIGQVVSPQNVCRYAAATRLQPGATAKRPYAFNPKRFEEGHVYVKVHRPGWGEIEYRISD